MTAEKFIDNLSKELKIIFPKNNISTELRETNYALGIYATGFNIIFEETVSTDILNPKPPKYFLKIHPFITESKRFTKTFGIDVEKLRLGKFLENAFEDMKKKLTFRVNIDSKYDVEKVVKSVNKVLKGIPKVIETATNNKRNFKKKGTK